MVPRCMFPLSSLISTTAVGPLGIPSLTLISINSIVNGTTISFCPGVKSNDSPNFSHSRMGGLFFSGTILLISSSNFRNDSFCAYWIWIPPAMGCPPPCASLPSDSATSRSAIPRLIPFNTSALVARALAFTVPFSLCDNATMGLAASE